MTTQPVGMIKTPSGRNRPAGGFTIVFIPRRGYDFSNFSRSFLLVVGVLTRGAERSGACGGVRAGKGVTE